MKIEHPKKGQKITLENSLHYTSVTVVMQNDNGVLTDSQNERVDRALCGMRDCECCPATWNSTHSDEWHAGYGSTSTLQIYKYAN